MASAQTRHSERTECSDPFLWVQLPARRSRAVIMRRELIIPAILLLLVICVAARNRWVLVAVAPPARPSHPNWNELAVSSRTVDSRPH